MIAGLAPAIHLLRSDLNSVIRAGGSRSATAGSARSASRLLVISEVALALALVTTAGLMVKSLLRLQAQDLGVTREPMLTFGVGVPPFVANGNDAVRRFQLDFLQKVRALPGVTHASGDQPAADRLHRQQRTGAPRRSDRRQRGRAGHRVPHRDGPLLRHDGRADVAGRALDERDRTSSAAGRGRQRDAGEAAVPDARSARGGRSADSASASVNAGPTNESRRRRRQRAIAPAGCAARSRGLRAVRAEPVAEHELVVRAARRSGGAVDQIRSTLAQMTPHVALAQMRTFEEVVANATRTSGLLSWLSVLFGVLAAALAILGIYSVMSYTVAQRERELAIRAAVGASRSTLLSMVLREGLLLSGAGIAAGAVIAFASSSLLRSLLYDVSATDPMVFVGSAVGLAGIAMAGYLIPAARAARVEPVTALRSE